MSKIHFFGDSFTYCQGCNSGEEYYDRTYDGTQKTWVSLISERIGLDYVNHAKPGIGNDKILDSVIGNLKNIKPNDVVFLSRTHDERLQIPHKNHFIDILPTLKYQHNSEWRDYYKTIEDYVKFILFPNFEGVTNRYEYLFNSFVEYFDSNNIKCIRWNVDEHTLTNDGRVMYPIISDEYTDINDSHWSWIGHQEFYKYIIKNLDN